MKKEELLGSVQAEIEYCENTNLPLSPSYAKTQVKTFELIDLYMNSRYRDVDTDSFGSPIPFYNIVSVPVEIASKMMDLDTKNIELMAEDENYWQTWLMQKELNFWMKDKAFGRQLNEYTYWLPRDGFLVVKKVGNDVQIVPLLNLRFRPDTDFKKTPIIERHYYQKDEFYAEAEKHDWENYKKVNITPNTVNVGEYVRENTIPTYEAYYPKGYLNSEYNYFIVSGDGVVLSYANIDNPYKATKWEEVRNRTTGRGQVEKLFNEQIYLNREACVKSEGLYWTSKHIYQTKDNSAPKNLANRIDNGTVLVLNSEITPVANEERNLAFYNYDEAKWESNSYRRTFTHEPLSGERAPSGTPLGSTVLQAQMSSMYYKQKKENIAEFVKEILYDWILPDFKKEKRKEHEIMVRSLASGDDTSDKFFKLLVSQELTKRKLDLWKKGRVVSKDEEMLLRGMAGEKVKGGKVKIESGMYEDLKNKIKIKITGEEIDSASKLSTLQVVIQSLSSNPTILDNPVVKRVFFKMLDIAGLNPMDVESFETQSLSQAVGGASAMRGGSVASPMKMPTATANLNVPTAV